MYSRSSPIRFSLIRCFLTLAMLLPVTSCGLLMQFEDCNQDQDCSTSLSYCAEDKLCKQYKSPVSLPSQCQLTAGTLEDSLPIAMLIPLSGPLKSFGEGMFLAAELALETISRDVSTQNLSLIACDSNELDGDGVIKIFNDLKIELIIGPILYNNLLKLQSVGDQLGSTVFLSPSLATSSLGNSSEHILSFANSTNVGDQLIQMLGEIIPIAKPTTLNKVKIFWISNIDSNYSRSTYEEVISKFDLIDDAIFETGEVEVSHQELNYSNNIPFNIDELKANVEENEFLVTVFLNQQEGWTLLQQLEEELNHPQSIYILTEWSMSPQQLEGLRNTKANNELIHRVFGLSYQSLFEIDQELIALANLFKSSFETRFYINPQFIPYSGRIYDLMFFATWAIERHLQNKQSLKSNVINNAQLSKVNSDHTSWQEGLCSVDQAPGYCVNPDGLRAIINTTGDRYLMGASGPLLSRVHQDQQINTDQFKRWCLDDQTVHLFTQNQFASNCGFTIPTEMD